MRFRAWVLQDWRVNAGRPDSQLLLAWFRLAQWAIGHWGALARVVITPYWWIPSLLFGVELSVGCVIIGDLHVGDHARVGALAVVLDSVPAWGIVVGDPGRVIRIDDRAVQQ